LPNSFDVLIFGTGPAGSATALAVLAAGVARVGLVGRAARPGWRIGESAPPELDHLLRGLGLDDDLGALGHLPYLGNVSGWGGTVQAHDFLRNGLGYGWHLDRSGFDAWLLDTAVKRGAVVIGAKAIDEINRDGDGWVATLRDGGARSLQVCASVIVVATGRAATGALGFGAHIRRIDELVAVAARYKSSADGPIPGYSVIDAVELGWWYSAPLPGGERIAMLMTDSELVGTHAVLQKPQFLALMSQSRLLQPLLPQCADTEVSLKTFPAATQFRDRASGGGWFAVGDALLAFDPLTSAGICGALTDATHVAGAIAKVVAGASAEEMKDLALAYADRTNRMLRRHVSERRAIYARETRWPNSEFWRSRSGATPDVATIGPSP
jgi:flavin-dependent dehydrogenase